MIRFLALAALLCTGCATRPVEPPRFEVFSKAKHLAVVMPGPAALPPRPFSQVVSDPTGELLAFDKNGAEELIVRDAVCIANTDVATHCAAGFVDLDRSYGTLLHQAQLLEQQHNYMAERWAQAEDELRQRERERMVETWLTRVLLAAALISTAD